MVIKIECDRKIKSLNIEFGDGDFCEVSANSRDEFKISEYKESNTRHKEPKQKTGMLLDLDDSTEEIVQEIVEKPVIEEKERAPAVAQEMQNLEF